MSDRTVFVSSVMAGMTAERQAVRSGVEVVDNHEDEDGAVGVAAADADVLGDCPTIAG